MLTRAILAVRQPALRRDLRDLLDRPDMLLEIVPPGTGAQLWRAITGRTADVIIADQSVLPAPPAESIRLLQEMPDSPAVAVIWQKDDPGARALLLAAGCEAVLSADMPPEAMAEVLLAIVSRREQATEHALLAERDVAIPRLADFVSQSPAMQAFLRVARRVVPSNVALLVLGETGVGKERLARAIHAESPRGHGPFIAVNCGALPESLLESELFGHEKGAFTGASRARRGLFELAHRGAVFLDEIGEMPYHLQVKLLRILQDHEVQPIGSERTMHVDVRVMAASNRDLEEEVRTGNFRRDLYYRLSVVTLTIPPLRERREDIPVLIDSYVDYLQPQIGCDVEGMADDAIRALTEYDWPGNVRELINVIERALLLCDGRQITADDLPQSITGRDDDGAGEGVTLTPDGSVRLPGAWLEKPWREVRQSVLEDVERAYLTGLLSATGGRVGQTAELAGLQPRSLYDKMKKLGLDKGDFRP